MDDVVDARFKDEDDVDFQLVLLNNAKKSAVEEDEERVLEFPSSSSCFFR